MARGSRPVPEPVEQHVGAGVALRGLAADLDACHAPKSSLSSSSGSMPRVRMSRPFPGAPIDRQCIPVSDLPLNQPVHPLAQSVVAL
jgi:hypothetical protein